MSFPRFSARSMRSMKLEARLCVEQLEDRVTPATLSIVQDINATTRPSDPQLPTDVNGTTFFATTDLLFGTNVWKTDGTAAGTVRLTNIVPPDQAFFSNLTALGSKLLFASQGKLWVSDGTLAGTGVIATFSPFSMPSQFAVLNGLAYFSANDGSSGNQLWLTDGTAAGTSMVTTVNPSAFGGLQPTSVIAFNSQLYFSGNDGINGTEMWISDGTRAGTQLLANLNPTSASSFPTSFTIVASRLFFAANDGTNGNQLWTSDGTNSGTTRITGFNASPFGGLAPTNLTALSGKLLFAGDDGSNGRELWVSDGTTAGTTMVADLRTGSTGSILPFYVAREIGGRLLFAANDGIHGVELWASDGTQAGTVMVADLWSGPNSGFGNATELRGFQGNICFGATDGTTAGLWSVDGTAAPALVAGSQNGVTFVSVVGTRLFFAADDIAHGREPWISDGTAPGTHLVADLNTVTNSSGPRSLNDVNGRLFFVADTGDRGSAGDFQLHITDGVTTTQLTNVPSPFGRIPEELTNVNGRVFFRADDGIHGPELWTSDGTAAGTMMVADINPDASPGTAAPALLRAMNGRVFFTTSDGVNGTELWVSDGTSLGTMMLADVFSGPSSSFPGDLTVVGNQLFFIAQGSVGSGRQLWVSDGTAAGANVVTHFPPAFDAVNRLWSAGGRLFFMANDGIHGNELWTSDGTDAGTRLYTELRPGPAGSVISEVVSANGRVFVSGEGRLWTSDGTPAGTVALTSFAPASFQQRPAKLTDVNGRLFFTGGDNSTGIELWTSDGTVSGTQMVVDLYPGSKFGDGNSSSPSSLTNLNGQLVFSAQDGVNGFQLWRSDGTAAGTLRVSDIAGLNASAFNPLNLTVNNGKLFFAASDKGHGNELWVASPPRVESIVVNDGGAQRSMVTRLTVTFSDIVTLDPTAFSLVNQNGQAVTINLTSSVVNGKTVAMLTFGGSGIIGGSLADGTFALRVVGGAVHDDQRYELDGDDNAAPGGDRASSLFRLFGDSDGDHDVDVSDTLRLLSALGSRSTGANYRWYLDYDADGDVDVRVDLIQLLRRL